MTSVRVTCPYCAQATHMAPAEIILVLHDGNRTTGEYAYTCPQCLRTAVHEASEAVVAELLAAGVTALPMTRAQGLASPCQKRLRSRAARPNPHDASTSALESLVQPMSEGWCLALRYLATAPMRDSTLG